MRVCRFAWMGLALVALLLQGLIALLAIWPPAIPVDFFQEWSSAHEVLAGRSAYPDLREAAPRLLGVPLDTSGQAVLVNAHPPPAILLGLPLAYLSYPSAVAVWRLISFLLILACARVIGRALGPLPPALTPPLPVAALLLLTSGPVSLTIFQGQLNAVLLALIVGAWWTDRVGREQSAGTLLGLAGALKLTPLLLLGYFAVRSRWRAVITGILTFLVANALTVVALGPGVYRDYAAALPRVAPHHRSGRTNASLPGLWAKLFSPGQGYLVVPLLRSPELDRLATLASVGTVAILAAVAVRRARSRGEQDRAFGLALTALLLVGPLTWEHTLLLLTFPLAVLARDWQAWGRRRRALFLVAVAAVWLLPYQIHVALGIRNSPAPPWMTLAALSYQCYALLILFALGRTIREVTQRRVSRAGTQK